MRDRYLVLAISRDGKRGSEAFDDAETAELFMKTLRLHEETQRFALVDLEQLSWTESPDGYDEDAYERAQAAYAARVEQNESLELERLHQLLAQNRDVNLEDHPMVELNGMKFVNVSGEQVPREIMEAMLSSMIDAGHVAYGANGELVPGPNAPTEGSLMSVDLDQTEAGEFEVSDPPRVIDPPTKRILN